MEQMRPLDDVFYEWLLDYMAPEYADQLSSILANEAQKYSKYQFLAGLLIGALASTILLSLL